MPFLSFIYRNGLWISMPVFVVSAGLLVFFISGVVRVVKQAQILSVPLLQEQELAFPEAGRVVLCTQGPLLSFRFSNLKYQLLDNEGMTVKGDSILFRGKTSGLSWVRMEQVSYTIPRPGHYILHVNGLEPGKEADSLHRIVFMRPHLARSIGYVIGIILAAFFLIGSVVLFFLRLVSQDNAA